MRFEAKHHKFKRFAANLGNFTNLPYTIAKRHQEGICYRLQTSEGNLSTFIKKGTDQPQSGLTSCTFPPWTEMPKKNYYDYD